MLENHTPKLGPPQFKKKWWPRKTSVLVTVLISEKSSNRKVKLEGDGHAAPFCPHDVFFSSANVEGQKC